MWRITPLDVGDMTYDVSETLIRRGMGQKANEKFVAWYVTDGKTKIVVDTGLPSLEQSQKYHSYTEPRIAENQKIKNALAAKGVDANEISLVLLTHLHWDHAGGLEHFPDARIIVSKEELKYAVDPCPIHYSAYDAAQPGHVVPAYLKVLPQIETITMEEQEILPGISMIPTPGHTVGSMSVVVSTDDGPYVITGDAVACYGNVYGDPEKGLRYLPSGIYTDVIDMWNSIALIDKKANYIKDHILPGHDSKVFEHESYPYK